MTEVCVTVRGHSGGNSFNGMGFRTLGRHREALWRKGLSSKLFRIVHTAESSYAVTLILVASCHHCEYPSPHNTACRIPCVTPFFLSSLISSAPGGPVPWQTNFPGSKAQALFTSSLSSVCCCPCLKGSPPSFISLYHSQFLVPNMLPGPV